MKQLTLMTCTFFGWISLTQAGGIASGGVGNPASQLCVQKGGSVEIVKTPDGEIGVCSLGRGLIEEWTLLRELSGTKSIAVQNLIHGTSKSDLFPGNPASVYCGRLGGHLIIVDGQGGQFGLCQFKDHSIIEEWTLLRGAQDSLNQKLMSVLGF